MEETSILLVRRQLLFKRALNATVTQTGGAKSYKSSIIIFTLEISELEGL